MRFPFVAAALLASAAAVSGPSFLAPSYANQYGTLDRRNTDLIITHNFSVGSGSVANMVDGVTGTNAFWYGVNSGRFMQFQFPYKVKITEVKWYQDIGTAHGVWKWEASDDAVTWTTVSVANFTLGGSATTTHDLSTNTTRYFYYKMTQVSGATATASWQREIEFKIDQPDPYPTYSFMNAGGCGNRTASVTVTASGSTSGTLSLWVDGSPTGTGTFFTAGGTTVAVRFQFATAKVMQLARVLRSGNNANGTWKWQGSNDGTTWTDTSTAQVWNQTIQDFNMDLGNLTPYLYHRAVMTAGTTSGTPWVYEWMFRISA